MLNVLDLFSGIGGFSLGLERAGGFRTVAFCEIDPYCRAVLRKHWPAVPCFEDVRDLHAFDVGPIDVICGGFPCQDISLAGNGAGLDGARSGLWSEYCRIIGACRPRWAVIENSPALRTRGYDRIKRDLAAIDYACRPFVVSAHDLGANHLRKRAWIIANPISLELREQPGRRRGSDGAEAPLVAGYGEARPVADPESISRGAGLREAVSLIDGDQLADGGCTVADADSSGLPQRSEPDLLVQREAAVGTGWWAVEPDVGRVANGVPSRVDRLKALGNAVVPQIPELIGRAILEVEGMTA